MEEQSKPCFLLGDGLQVTDLKKAGFRVYQYKYNVGTVSESPNRSNVDVITGPTKNIFVIVKSSSLPDLTRFPEDVSAPPKLSCQRCKYLVRHAEQQLELARAVGRDDIAGICDHCRVRRYSERPQLQDLRSMCDHIITEHLLSKLRQTKGLILDEIPLDATIPWTYFKESRNLLHKGFKQPLPLLDIEKPQPRRLTSDDFIKHLSPTKEYAKNEYFYPKCIETAEDAEFVPGTKIKVNQPEIPQSVSALLLTERQQPEKAKKEMAGLQSILHRRFKNEIRGMDKEAQEKMMTIKFKQLEGKIPYVKWEREKNTLYEVGGRELEDQIEKRDMKGKERRKLVYDEKVETRGYDDEDYDQSRFSSKRKFRSRSLNETERKKGHEVTLRPSDEINWRKDKHKFVTIGGKTYIPGREGKGSKPGSQRGSKYGTESEGTLESDFERKSKSKLGKKPGTSKKSEHVLVKSRPFEEILKRSQKQQLTRTSSAEIREQQRKKKKEMESEETDEEILRRSQKQQLTGTPSAGISKQQRKKKKEMESEETDEEILRRSQKQQLTGTPSAEISKQQRKKKKEMESEETDEKGGTLPKIKSASQEKQGKSSKVKAKDIIGLGKRKNKGDGSLTDAIRKGERKTDDSLISEIEGSQEISEVDMITAAMKGRKKLRDRIQSKDVAKKSLDEGKDVLSKDTKMIKHKGLKSKGGKGMNARKTEKDTSESKDNIGETSKHQVKQDDSKEDLSPQSLLKAHLKSLKKSAIAGNRDADAIAKAEKQMDMHRSKVELNMAKAATLRNELPPIFQKHGIFHIMKSVSRDFDVQKDSKLKKSFSDVELDNESLINKSKMRPTSKMIKKTAIIKYSPTEYVIEPLKNAPEFFESDFTKFPSIELVDKSTSSGNVIEKSRITELDENNKNIMRYSLSNRKFIDKGWTVLPTERVIRKMNVYRMHPTNPENNWFKRNQNKGIMFYDTGEKLAEFEKKGRGRCYYKSGRIALDYYDAEEPNAGQRYVVYSSGDPDKRGCPRPVTVLAMFDHAGNGIVYDHDGKTRLKYNQSEGIVLDPTLVSSKWKWHSLNDPPVLQQIMQDSQLAHKDPKILNLGEQEQDHKEKRCYQDKKMLAIEFQNFVKEKMKKQLLNFNPFQIKMKALRINDEFSLKIVNQKTIYLTFQDCSTRITFNLGMVLDNKEIVDTETVELGVIANTLEKFPARTCSIENLQKILESAQKKKQQRVDKENRLIPPIPKTVESSDKMAAALSRPLRTIGNVPAGSPCGTINQRNIC